MDDLIYKQTALDAIDAWRREYPLDLQEPIDDCWNSIRELPAVQPDHNADIGKKAEKDDCISRQWLMECVSEGWIKFDTKKDENRFMHLVRDIAPSAQPEQRWIPCSERLPEESGKYLVTVLDGIGKRTTSAPYHLRSKSWTLTGRMAYWKVIAWRPLPEPYRRGDTE